MTIHHTCGWLGWLSAALALGVCAAASAQGQQSAPHFVRVELFERTGAARVGGHWVAATRGGLRVDGRPLGGSLRLAGPGPHETDTHVVRGSLEVRPTPRGLQVINRVPLEDYVAATVGGELGGSWEDEVLKAQAVASRTYALYHQSRRRGQRYDVSAGTRHQVYAGVAGETPRIRRAARATAGEVLLFQGAPILAAFHAASGGRTASSAEVWGRSLPYLPSVPVPTEGDSPSDDWRAVIPGPTLARALGPLGLHPGAVRELCVVERSPSGRARTLWVGGTEGAGRLSARDLRRALGTSVIRSTMFEVREAEGEFVFAGSGHGHGVGMSQWGARAMARAGASYREILAAFYPGAVLGRLPAASASVAHDRAVASLEFPAPRRPLQ